MNKVLYISSEVFPLIKTGGLADVAGSLPLALQRLGEDVRILIPAYPAVLAKLKTKKIIATTRYYNLETSIIESRLPGSKVIIWLVDNKSLYERAGGPYIDNHGVAWQDNALRFSVLCHAAVDIAVNQLSLNWQPDIVHCNDWQTGLVPALLSRYKQRPATIFTIHNLAYQGNFTYQTFLDLELDNALWHMDALEFYGQLSFIKGGIAFADNINAVSPSYAKEILADAFSYGHAGLLRHRKTRLSGIVNGIDEKQWNPGTDTHIFKKYNSRSIKKKVNNKTALQQQLKLPINEELAMIGMVGRLVEQKGLDIILTALEELLILPIQLVILGTGDTHYELELNRLATKHAKKLKVIVGYQEDLAHQIEAACDIYLMPSIFEPCGLNQLYSLRYGSIPIVTPVGGLLDTVVNTTQHTLSNKTASGFVMPEVTSDALLMTVKQALRFYADKPSWQQIQSNAMAYDSSWTNSAKLYITLYKEALINRNKLLA